ncbi:hypothetical protein PV328_009853 [Microctonus aethiopoides]|uniref:Dynein heavy chain, cytoplasmic n=1 Tax=Microctonus aethiopoides TaxID=144406 RepID=A0AA39C7L7_9HYME|nr:hypothetical protein PV328_009853 [Microctonus aethiopoides]
MVIKDMRETFIVSMANDFLGIRNKLPSLNPEDHASLDKFLDVSTCRALCAQRNYDDGDNIELKLTNDLSGANGKTLVFFKTKISTVTNDNLHDLVQVTSIIGNPGSILIEALHQVWSPTLQSSGVNLTCLKKLEEDILGPKPPLSLIEEEALWMKKYEETKKSRDKKVIDEIIKIIKNIKNELENAAVSRDGLSGLEEILETVAGYVDDLWKLESSTYTEERMKILLNIIGNEIPSLVHILLAEIHDADIREKDEAAANGATICEKWVNICERLTTLFWPHQSLHPWTGPVFIPTKCLIFGERLRQIVDIRLQYRQLSQLLSESERSSLNSLNLLQNFDDFKIISSDNERDIEWMRLKRRFEDGISPAEERVTENLKKHLASVNNPILLVGEFQKYTELLKRDNIKQTLRGERETLLSILHDVIGTYQCGPDTENLLNSPQILQEIQAARLAESKLNSLNKLVKTLLNDLPGYTDAISKIASAIKEAEMKRINLVESWMNETKDSIVKKKLSLEVDSPVVELIGKNMMKVNYDPKLMALVKEARALSGMGIELPREIRNLVECAGALAGRARALQQIANFHNTIGDRMIVSQRPLMLSTALELARAVQEQSGVIWSDLHAVDSYTNRLREFVQKFAKQNSELATKHIHLRDLVTNLLKGEVVNLVGSQVVWKDTLKKMRMIVDEVESVYGNSKAWKLHWDRQLLKVLGTAYRAALPNLVRKLPEIRVELIYRDNNLQWRPPLEEIRAKLYSGVRRFLAIPMNFRGVGDPVDGKFGIIVGQSAHLFGGVYKEAESALASLEILKSKWMVLTTPTKSGSECLKEKSSQEWEKDFKNAKQWAQEIVKLRGGEIKVYCFTIDTTTTRNDLESTTRRYWEHLSSDLRAEASSRLVTVVNFLSSAMKELDRRPANVEEVGLAYEAHKKIEEGSRDIGRELEYVTGLAKVMAAWTRERLDGINEAYASWDGLSVHLERHKTVITRQLEDAKINLRHRAIAFKDERERWETRWTSKPEIITLDWLSSMRERLTSLEEQKDILISDCQRVELEISDMLNDESEIFKNLEAQLEAEESNCRFQAEFMRELDNQVSDEWSIAKRRIARFHDWVDSWEERIKIKSNDSDVNEKSKMEIDTFVGKTIRKIRDQIEWVQLLRGDELAEEHWNELKIILKLETNIKDMTLGNLLNAASDIELNVDKVKEIIKRAIAETGIRQALIELESWEASASLRLHESKDSKNVTILLVGEYSELLARTGELKLLIEGAKGASGYERFSARAMRCELALFELEERVKFLGLLQRKWVYLEPVYSSGAAPDNSGRWSRADKEFRYLMGEVARDPRVPSLRRLPLPALSSLKDLLDKCQKSLDEFLEEKRSAYPRLYFLSDDDLLELISNSTSGLNTHLPKLFQGIASVERQNGYLTSIISPEGEILLLSSSIDLSDPLPIWLKHLEEVISDTLHQSLEKCIIDTNLDQLLYPTQILLLSERISFTERCEIALRDGKSSMKNLVGYLETRRTKFRNHEYNGDSLIAQKARNLLLETVYHLDIARSLLKLMENNEKTSWTWSRQLRCYKTKNGPIVKCAGAEFSYKFEYQGAVTGLVRTPLTERCFLALTQAMKLGLGGSPTGPAGTGKTESVKALAAILGRLVLVFNCDEGMDAGSMKRILSGLAQAGAWGCFDEFNRLEEKTLSAVAMLVRPLQEAVRLNLNHVQLDNENVKLNPNCCVFITMNPSGSDYGGRNKLPDSLARLFRPIGMAHPDRCDIVRALLECAGFSDASTLSRQLIETLDIAEKLLTKQPHYDWSLRALRSIVDGISDNSGLQNETHRVLEAIKSAIIPKLIEEDMIKFKQLLDDVFPNLNSSQSEIPIEKQKLKKALKEICDSKNLQTDVVTRCEQLFDQLKGRTGVAIVGAPGSGKTSVRKILFEALTLLGDNLKEILIYPGAISKSLLLGKVDSQTREWKEGLLSTAISSNGDGALWIVFDGDVEPGWAEALNSALDDNRLLTLPSGVSVKLGARVKFIFETHKLAGSSPATVSRLGVIHLAKAQPSVFLSSTILDQLPSASKNIATNHLITIIEASSTISPATAANLISATFLHLLRASTTNLVTYALLMSICMQIADRKSRENIAKVIYQCTDSWCPDPEKPLDVIYNGEIDRLEPFVDDTTIIKTNHGHISLTNALKRGLASILPWFEDGYPIIIRGPEGCGRTSLISYLLASTKDNIEASSIVYASSLFGPDDLINRLKRSCVRVESSINGRVYRPRSGSKVILIVEEIHLAAINFQELIRQLVQEGGFYEDDLEFAHIQIKLVSTADTSTKLHSRLNSLLAIHYLSPPTSKDISTIVKVHLNNVLKNVKFITDIWISNLAVAMYESLTAISSSKDSTFSWTISDLCLWSSILKSYPVPEEEGEVSRYLFDIGKRLFYPRLSSKDQNRWRSTFIARLLQSENNSNDIYVWHNGNSTLIPIADTNWSVEIESTASKCAREGEPIEATITSHLLSVAAGLSWAMGCGRRGIILIGRPGSGRKSATKLAASYSSWRLIDSAPNKARSAIKIAIQSAGIDGERTALLLEEHHLRENGLAILIEAIVSRGEIPGLLSPEELDGFVAPLIDLSRNEDFTGTLDQYLYHRLRKFLRVILIVDSTDIKKEWMIKSRLLNHCTQISDLSNVEWWTSESSLIDLAIRKIPGLANDVNDTDLMSSGLKALVESHQRAPSKQQSPARFIALLNIWHELRDQWERDIEMKLESLQAGIGKLKDAGDRVAELENEALKQRKEFEEEKKKANAALEQITATMRGATGQRGEMSTLKADTERESVELTRRKADIERELGKVEPLVEAAAQAVAGIGADALAEVRSLRAPPAAVRDILEGVLRLMGIRDTSWNSMKIFLAKRGVKDEIRNWDARRSTSASLEAVANLIKERPDSFEEKTARRASVAAAPLAAWVLANLQYGQILQQVAPLEREQRLLAERLSAAEAQIDRLAAGLTSVESRVAELQIELAEHSRGAAALQLRSEATEASLTTARALLTKLDAEHNDWQSQLECLSLRKIKLGIEAAEAASLLVYQDPSKDDKWKRATLDLLITERERLIWRAQNLPTDTVSLLGAACALRGPLVPLFMDSSGVAVTWLKINLGSQLEITKPEDSKFLTTLELAVRFGKRLLIEEIVELPTILLPLLRKRPLRLSERTLPAQHGFKLFLATRRDNIDTIPGEAEAVLFKITLGAGTRSLAERFIEKALLLDTPELEKQRREALELEERLAGERDTARLDLLVQLGAARGQDLLQESTGGERGSLLTSLEATQTKAKEIAKALDESRRHQEEISKRSKEHEKLAKFAANLFKAIKSLVLLNPLYVFSAEEFTDIYLEAESTRKKLADVDKKEQELLIEKNLISLTFQYCAKAVYRKHRLPLALHLALNLNPISDIEKNLLQDGGNLKKKDDVESNIPDWIPDERKCAVKLLASTLPQIAAKLRPNWIEDIKNIYRDTSLSVFHKVLVIQALRPDYLYSALTKFVTEQLGVKNLAPPAWTLETIAQNTKERHILLLLSPGADPGPELRALAVHRQLPEGFVEISLGQGQVKQAEEAIERACRNGGWVLLSNLQLALNWLPRLESILRSDNCTNAKNPSSRIWLTTEECYGFYPGLAGICLKLTYEPPEGVKRNMTRSLRQLQGHQTRTNNSEGIFVLAWLHAVLQERRRFIPQGWICSYEWSDADLEAAYELVINHSLKLNPEAHLDWEEGRGLLNVAIYGGRLQDQYDMRALDGILKNIWSRDTFHGRCKLGGIMLVSEVNKKDVFRVIDQLPDSDNKPMEIFGLPPNALRAWERSAAETALAALKDMSTRSLSATDRRMAKIAELKHQQDLKNFLECHVGILKIYTKSQNSQNSIDNFFEDERILTNKLISIVKFDVDNLRISNSKTPKTWLEHWPSGPVEIQQFISGLISRNEFLSSLTYSPRQSINLGRLARPRAFLAALKQHTAREYNYSLEKMKLNTHWIDKSNDKYSEKLEWKTSVILDGLFITGALIINGKLNEVNADAAPVSNTPRCQIAYLPEEYETNLLNDELNDDEIQIPVYSDSHRNNLICTLSVGCCKEDQGDWCRRGVIIHLESN